MADSRRIERKTVSFRTASGTLVEVGIYINADKHELGPDEQRRLALHLADDAMLSIQGAPFLTPLGGGRPNLAKMRVK